MRNFRLVGSLSLGQHATIEPMNEGFGDSTVVVQGLCPKCAFDLRGLAAPGNCPECGHAFTLGTILPLRSRPSPLEVLLRFGWPGIVLLFLGATSMTLQLGGDASIGLLLLALTTVFVVSPLNAVLQIFLVRRKHRGSNGSPRVGIWRMSYGVMVPIAIVVTLIIPALALGGCLFLAAAGGF